MIKIHSESAMKENMIFLKVGLPIVNGSKLIQVGIQGKKGFIVSKTKIKSGLS